MTFQILQGDVIARLREMPEESVHCVVTSPPYWGLRDYGIEPSVWGGDPECEHQWDEISWGQRHVSAFCRLCHAWRGCLGLEPAIDLYLEHMVLVFREVRRVLYSSGTLWLNIGDSYCSDAGAERKPSTTAGPRVPAGWTNRSQPLRVHSAFRKGGDRDPKRGAAAENAIHRGVAAQESLKPKDLAMMPARVALALQADGWYLRSQIPWIKRTAMPESVTDRPTSAIEYIFLLSKAPDYFYDREAARIASTGNAHVRGEGVSAMVKAMGPNSRMRRDQDPYHQTEARIRSKQNRSFSEAVRGLVSSRARRNSDWFTESYSGLLADSIGNPLALLVNPQPFTLEMCRQCEQIYEQKIYRKLPTNGQDSRVCACGASDWLSHFATFPEKLVMPCVQAGTSEHGVCQHCGAPYERIVEIQYVGDWHPDPKNKHNPGAINGTAKWAKADPGAAASRMNGSVKKKREAKHAADASARNGDPVNSWYGLSSHDQPFMAPRTLGWRATCEHPLYPSEPVPAIVLDPFSGSGRTGIAAVKLGRSYIGFEANPRYARMSEYQFGKLELLPAPAPISEAISIPEPCAVSAPEDQPA